MGILLLNAVVLAIVFLFFSWLLSRGGRIVFTGREVWLCLALAMLISSILDYQLLIKPLWEMETAVQRYRENSSKGSPKSMYEGVEDDSIETILYELLRQGELAHEKDRIAEKQRKKAELYALQSQIDPHFLYNALDSIRGYALLRDMEEIAEITEALSRIFRNVIGDKHEQIPLRQEMDNINSYMKIQQFRFNNKFHYSFEAEAEILDQYMVPRMVLQPLVENAIMHGLERKIDGGWIKVNIYVTERRFVMVVSDNGVGISEERLAFLHRAMKVNPVEQGISEESNHVGIALININQRIKLNYGKQYGITLCSTPNVRTSTEVVLPLLLNRK